MYIYIYRVIQILRQSSKLKRVICSRNWTWSTQFWVAIAIAHYSQWFSGTQSSVVSVWKTSVHLLSAFKSYMYNRRRSLSNPRYDKHWGMKSTRTSILSKDSMKSSKAGVPASRCKCGWWASKMAKCHQCVSLCRSGGEKIQKLYLWATNSGNVERIWKVPNGFWDIPKIKQQEPHKNPKGRQRSVRLLLKMMGLFWNGCIFPNSHWLLKKFQWAVSLFGRLLEEPLDAFYRWCPSRVFRRVLAKGR